MLLFLDAQACQCYNCEKTVSRKEWWRDKLVRKTIGIIIADDKEFAPVHLIQPKGAQKQQGSFYGMDTVPFFIARRNGK